MRYDGLGFYLIKPDGMPKRDAIRAVITDSGLAILDSRLTFVSEEALEVFYPRRCSEEIFQVLLRFFQGQLCEVGLVDGEDAAERLVRICGASTEPEKCGEGTIRRTFASGRRVRIGGITAYENVIHRSRPREVESHAALFAPWACPR